MSKFKEKVIEVVKLIPEGEVVSYGQVALMSGAPGAAQAVGQILNSLEDDLISSDPDIPWWRVVNNSGRISIKGTKYHDARMQRNLLREESVLVSDDFEFDIEKYRFRPDIKTIESWGLDDEYVEMIADKYLF